MLKPLLRAFAGRCEVHDRPAPQKIAELEVATGVNPDAVRELWATGDFMAIFYDPDLTDCGSARCRKRRADG